MSLPYVMNNLVLIFPSRNKCWSVISISSIKSMRNNMRSTESNNTWSLIYIYTCMIKILCSMLFAVLHNFRAMVTARLLCFVTIFMGWANNHFDIVAAVIITNENVERNMFFVKRVAIKPYVKLYFVYHMRQNIDCIINAISINLCCRVDKITLICHI